MPGQTNTVFPKALTDITADWLTDVLRAGGVISQQTRVATIECEHQERWYIADTARLHCRYDPPGRGPATLFAKHRAEPDPFEDFIPGEYAFYAAGPPTVLPTPRCYHAQRDAHTGATLLLLEDLGATYMTLPWSGAPSGDQLAMAARALARVHAATLDEMTRKRETSEHMRRREQAIADHCFAALPGVLDDLGGTINKRQQRLITQAFENYQRLKMDRLLTGPTCLVHGDPHAWNLMFPQESADGADCIVIDWEDWRIDFPGSDLGILLFTNIATDLRRDMTPRVLQSYQDECARLGVRLSDDVMRDYRLGFLCNAIIPVFQREAEDGTFWRTSIETWLTAADDLGFEALLSC